MLTIQKLWFPLQHVSRLPRRKPENLVNFCLRHLKLFVLITLECSWQEQFFFKYFLILIMIWYTASFSFNADFLSKICMSIKYTTGLVSIKYRKQFYGSNVPIKFYLWLCPPFQFFVQGRSFISSVDNKNFYWKELVPQTPNNPLHSKKIISVYNTPNICWWNFPFVSILWIMHKHNNHIHWAIHNAPQQSNRTAGCGPFQLFSK
jgi:hypothetical protein